QIAKQTLAKEPKLSEIQQQLSKSYNDIKQLKDCYLKLIHSSPMEHQTSNESQLSLDVILAQLQSLATDAENRTNELAESVLYTEQNDHDINVFIKNFMQERKEAAELKLKADIFEELFIAQQRLGQ
ncbi:unnamed protein product, partial [Didymodactylos carnosus]